MSGREDGRIVVYVDDQPRELFLGMRVRHAIGYGRVTQVERHEAVVEDCDGHRVDLDGALYDGQRLKVVSLPSRSRRKGACMDRD